MLVNLTLNKEEIKKSYLLYKDFCNEFNHTCPDFKDYLGEYEAIEPGFYGCADPGSPKRKLKNYYKEFTKIISYEEEFNYFKDCEKPQYGIVDNIDQLRKYYKEEIDDPNQKIVFFLQYIKHHPERAGKTGGFRPEKWGEYLGKYSQIEQYEYYDDCIFEDEDYQGYLICFHLIPVV